MKTIILGIVFLLMASVVFAAPCSNDVATLSYGVNQPVYCDADNGIGLQVSVFPEPDKSDVMVNFTDYAGLTVDTNDLERSLGNVTTPPTGTGPKITTYQVYCNPDLGIDQREVIFTITYNTTETCEITEDLSLDVAAEDPSIQASQGGGGPIIFNQQFGYGVGFFNTGGNGNIEVKNMTHLEDMLSTGFAQTFDLDANESKELNANLTPQTCQDYSPVLKVEYSDVNGNPVGVLTFNPSFSVQDPLDTTLLEVSGTDVTEGTEVTLKASIRNLAKYNVTGGYNVSFYDGDELIETVHYDDTIVANSTKQVTYNWPTSGKVGDHTFKAYAISDVSGCGSDRTTLATSANVKINSPQIDDGGGAPSGGGGGGGSFVSGTTTELDISKAKETNVQLGSREGATFNVKGEDHTLRVDVLYRNSVRLRIRSRLLIFILNVGKTESIDFDEDGKDDIAVKLNKIEDNKADMTITNYNFVDERPSIKPPKKQEEEPEIDFEIEPEVKPSEELEEVIEETEEEITGAAVGVLGVSKLTWIIVSVFLVVVLVVSVWAFRLHSRFKKSTKKFMKDFEKQLRKRGKAFFILKKGKKKRKSKSRKKQKK